MTQFFNNIFSSLWLNEKNLIRSKEYLTDQPVINKFQNNF